MEKNVLWPPAPPPLGTPPASKHTNHSRLRYLLPQQWSVLNEPSGPYSSALSSLVNCTPDDDRRCWSSPPGNRLSSQYAAEPGRTAAAASSSSSGSDDDDGDSRRTDIAAAEGPAKTGYGRLKGRRRHHHRHSTRGRLVHTIDDDDSRKHVPRTTDDDSHGHNHRRRTLPAHWSPPSSAVGDGATWPPPPPPPAPRHAGVGSIDNRGRWQTAVEAEGCPVAGDVNAAAKARVYGVLPPRKSARAVRGGGRYFLHRVKKPLVAPHAARQRLLFRRRWTFRPHPSPMHSATTRPCSDVHVHVYLAVGTRVVFKEN